MRRDRGTVTCPCVGNCPLIFPEHTAQGAGSAWNRAVIGVRLLPCCGDQGLTSDRFSVSSAPGEMDFCSSAQQQIDPSSWILRVLQNCQKVFPKELEVHPGVEQRS